MENNIVNVYGCIRGNRGTSQTWIFYSGATCRN